MTADTGTSTKSWFTLPEPVRRVFNQFPLITYEPNALPQRAPPTLRSKPCLYIHQPVGTSKTLSPNPACLKWQAFLNFKGIEYDSIDSNSHASPSGSLPFLLPADDVGKGAASPTPANKIPNWVKNHGGDTETSDIRYDAYMSLISLTIRNAWLYSLYLDEDNFANVAVPTYIRPASRVGVVQYALGRQLKEAVRSEILKTNAVIDAEALYRAAAEALDALSTLLGQDEYFFGQSKPGLFDASVFSYIYPLSGNGLQWRSTELVDAMADHPNLLHHCGRICKQYFRS